MTGAVASAASVSQHALAVSIDAGQSAASHTSGHTFPANNAHVSGGTGGYTFAWAISATDGAGSWTFTGQGTSAATPIAYNVAAGGTTFTTLSLTVTDRSGQRGIAQAVSYSYTAGSFGGVF